MYWTQKKQTTQYSLFFDYKFNFTSLNTCCEKRLWIRQWQWELQWLVSMTREEHAFKRESHLLLDMLKYSKYEPIIRLILVCCFFVLSFLFHYFEQSPTVYTPLFFFEIIILFFSIVFFFSHYYPSIIDLISFGNFYIWLLQWPFYNHFIFVNLKISKWKVWTKYNCVVFATYSYSKLQVIEFYVLFVISEMCWLPESFHKFHWSWGHAQVSFISIQFLVYWLCFLFEWKVASNIQHFYRLSDCFFFIRRSCVLSCINWFCVYGEEYVISFHHWSWCCQSISFWFYFFDWSFLSWHVLWLFSLCLVCTSLLLTARFIDFFVFVRLWRERSWLRTSWVVIFLTQQNLESLISHLQMMLLLCESNSFSLSLSLETSWLRTVWKFCLSELLHWLSEHVSFSIFCHFQIAISHHIVQLKIHGHSLHSLDLCFCYFLVSFLF